MRSITWDQGNEMARHVEFIVATGVPIYFSDPTHHGRTVQLRAPSDYFASICRREPTHQST